MASHLETQGVRVVILTRRSVALRNILVQKEKGIVTIMMSARMILFVETITANNLEISTMRKMIAVWKIR